MRIRTSVQHALAILLLMLCLSAAATADDEQVYRVDLPEQSVADALTSLSEQTGVLVLFSYDIAELRTANPVKGEYTLQEAMDALLQGTGLSGGLSQRRVMQISLDETAERNNEEGEKEMSGQGDVGTTTKRRGLLGVLAAAFSVGAWAQEAADTEDADVRFDEIIVTGTNIRGVKDQFSPVVQIGRKELDLAGQATLSDVFRTLPQNVSGGASPAATGAGDAQGAGSLGVNLRGLGNEATLVLLNGRRLSPSGGFGSFVDISAIPTSAIDRIEVVTDGASAIYGSDAIAGVVNIVLRDDFQGAETRLNASTLTDGGGDTVRIGQTVGFDSSRAHGLVSYEYSSEDEVDANERSFSEVLDDPFFLLPSGRKHSVFASGGLKVSDRVFLSVDSYFNDRKSETFTSFTSGQPLRISQDAHVQQYGGALGVDIHLAGDWEVNIDGTHSQNDFWAESVIVPVVSTAGHIFESDTSVTSADVTVGGSLFSLTDEPARGVFGFHYRREDADLSRFNRLRQSVSFESDRSRDVLAGYGELYVPVVTDARAIPGVRRLAATAAVRYEDYSDAGSSVNPKFGLVWSPFQGLNLRGTFGTSFRAPRLDQLIDADIFTNINRYVDPLSSTGESVALEVVSSTNPDLAPEEADTWTLGVDFSPAFAKNLDIRATYFNIQYDGRVAVPLSLFDSSFRFINFPGVPIRNPSLTTVQDFVDRSLVFTNVGDLLPLFGLPPLPEPLELEDVTVILDSRLQNLSSSEAEGVDVEIAYGFDTAGGNWLLTLNATILTKFTEQFSSEAPLFDALDTFRNPVDLRLRGGGSWSHGAFSAAVFINHVDEYTDDEAIGGPVSIDAFTTVDATLQVDLGQWLDARLFQDTTLSANVTNVFNEEPPSIGERPPFLNSIIYDPVNASPLGRRVSVLLNKRW